MAEKGASYRFGEFRLDPDASQLLRAGTDLDLPPRAFQVLAYLVANHRRVVPKQELVEAIWKDTFVTDDALVQAIAALRRALGDDAESPRYIRTKARLGYQFIAEVHEGAEAEAADPAEVSVWQAPVTRPRARSLLLAIQVGYLALYAVTLFNLDIGAGVLDAYLLDPIRLGGHGVALLVVLALTGVAVRLYLITTVAVNHPQAGRQYRRLFPALLVFDEVWAVAPLLLVGATGLPIALALVPVLVYGPFAQHTLMRSAYPT